MSSETVILVISAILIVTGILGSILPFLPGTPFGFVGLLLYGFVSDFQTVKVKALVVFGFLTLLTLILDVLAPIIAAKGYKASKAGMIGAVAGTILGIPIMGPFGIIIGPFVGTFLGEYWKNRNEKKALHIAWGALIGFLVSTIVRTAVALAMGIYFIWVVLK